MAYINEATVAKSKTQSNLVWHDDEGNQYVRLEIQAVSGVPTAATSGSMATLNVDPYGMQRIAGYDYSSDSLRFTDVAPAETMTFGPVAFAQITAATGATAAVNVEPYNTICYQITVASINTTVDVRVEGSLNGSSWFNMDDSGSDTQYSADGTYRLDKSGVAVKYVRLHKTDESGGTAVTLDGYLFAKV